VYYDIVGPICESGDYIGSGRLLQETFRGDLLCVLNAGAYCMSMASNYNSRLRAAEVLVEGAKEVLIRKRESYKDLVIKETIKEKKISYENKIL
jgi:diaminopimelate decarboxylase